ncbi:MAG: SMI1/KNR4 family protein [Myxococcales bacterium]|nr:SMI1/KNR4 family protein [Myxococcales bacterium]
MFEDFDLRGFWEDSDYARKNYVGKAVTPELVVEVEAELGFKLPAAYVELMRSQNGGVPVNTCFPTDDETSWAEDHVAITGFYSIGSEQTYSLLGDLGSRFMQEEWGYPTFGICICDCPSAGHDLIMLDYRKCGPQGEPSVIHVDQDLDYEVTELAPNFESFIRGLVHSDTFDNAEAELADTLELIRAGSFSSELRALLTPKIEAGLRALLVSLAEEKGYFALHGDPKSVLVYDLLFDLYTRAHAVGSVEAYLAAYPALIAFGDGDISTNGYAPGFVEDWLGQRIAEGLFRTENGKLVMADAQRSTVMQALGEFG